MAVDEAGLIGSEEEDGLGLLDGLAEATSGEVNLATHALGDVVAEPVLEEGSVERRRAERVEAVTLAGVDHGELAGQGKDGTLGGGVGKLGSSSADEGDNGGGVDDGALLLAGAAKSKNGVLATEPNTLDVDVLGQVPDLLGSVDGIVVAGVHDAGVVEHDVHAAPGVDRLDEGLDLVLLGNIADLLHRVQSELRCPD